MILPLPRDEQIIPRNPLFDEPDLLEQRPRREIPLHVIGHDPMEMFLLEHEPYRRRQRFLHEPFAAFILVHRESNVTGVKRSLDDARVSDPPDCPVRVGFRKEIETTVGPVAGLIAFFGDGGLPMLKSKKIVAANRLERLEELPIACFESVHGGRLAVGKFSKYESRSFEVHGGSFVLLITVVSGVSARHNAIL